MSPKRPRRADHAQRPVDDLADLLEEVIEVSVDRPLLQRALTHRSYAYENGNLPHNERQEFLGDAVLGVIVTDSLYRVHPDEPEGQLAKYRASVVNSRALAGVARQLGLGDYLLLGRGETVTGGRDKDSILADATEAVIGTVYLSGGIEAATRLVHYLVDELMDRAADLGAGLDWKTSLQELCARLGLGAPMYAISEQGPDHDKEFTAHAVIAEISRGVGVGRNKKAAEQIAAQQAYQALKGLATATKPLVAPAGSSPDGAGA